jgi:hypothetical protein
MLDYQCFGLYPGRHHLTSVLWHAANTVLLLVVLRGMTGALWRSAVVAALFALHPLHVESVAWVAERKDVLSTFFVLLMLWAYHRYAECRMQKSTTFSTPPATRPTFHVSRFTFHQSHIPVLPPFPLLLRPWPDEQADDRDSPIAVVAAGLLAAGENAEC